MTTSRRVACTVQHLRDLLPQRIGPVRLSHVSRVEDTAVAIARRFGIALEPVRIAALAHDMDRELSQARALALARDWNIALQPWERRNPVLAHGAVSAARLSLQFGCRDAAVLGAVRHHTLGHPEMGAVGLVLFVADYCEPGRSYLDDRTRRHILSLRDLGHMVASVIEHNAARHPDRAPPTRALLERVTAGEMNG